MDYGQGYDSLARHSAAYLVGTVVIVASEPQTEGIKKEQCRRKGSASSSADLFPAELSFQREMQRIFHRDHQERRTIDLECRHTDIEPTGNAQRIGIPRRRYPCCNIVRYPMKSQLAGYCETISSRDKFRSNE